MENFPKFVFHKLRAAIRFACNMEGSTPFGKGLAFILPICSLFLSGGSWAIVRYVSDWDVTIIGASACAIVIYLSGCCWLLWFHEQSDEFENYDPVLLRVRRFQVAKNVALAYRPSGFRQYRGKHVSCKLNRITFSEDEQKVTIVGFTKIGQSLKCHLPMSVLPDFTELTSSDWYDVDGTIVDVNEDIVTIECRSQESSQPPGDVEAATAWYDSAKEPPRVVEKAPPKKTRLQRVTTAQGGPATGVEQNPASKGQPEVDETTRNKGTRSGSADRPPLLAHDYASQFVVTMNEAGSQTRSVAVASVGNTFKNVEFWFSRSLIGTDACDVRFCGNAHEGSVTNEPSLKSKDGSECAFYVDEISSERSVYFYTSQFLSFKIRLRDVGAEVRFEWDVENGQYNRSESNAS